MKSLDKFFLVPFVFLALTLIAPNVSVAQIQVGGNSYSLSPTENAVVTTPNNTGGTVNTPNNTGPAVKSGTGQTIVNPLKVDSLTELLTLVLDAVVKIGAIILTLAIIWVGFLFVKAQGNAEEVSSARKALVWTVIGGLILLGAEAISVVIASTVSNI